jgi:hypothetical protein
MSKSTRQLEVYNDVLSFEQGIEATLVRVTGGTYNPVTEVTTGATSTSYGIAVCFVKASKNETIPDNFELTDPKQRVIILAGKGIVPDKSDELTIDSVTWQIFGAIESSGGDDALFRCYIKQG